MSSHICILGGSARGSNVAIGIRARTATAGGSYGTKTQVCRVPEYTYDSMHSNMLVFLTPYRHVILHTYATI